MYIIRWLLGNPIVMTWMVLAFGVIATLLFFGSGSKNKEETLSPGTAAISSVEEINIAIDNDGKEPESTIIIKEEALIVVSSDKVKDDSSEKVEKLLSKETAVATLSPAVEPIKSGLQEIKAPVDNTAALDKSNATTDLSQVTNEEMLLMAREAYWNNGLDEAAQIYNKLIENEPEVFEHKGELGNVYWRQGYPEKAAELYSEIAIPMIESGGSDRVANMIGFIGLFYPERAAEIHKKMQSQK